MVRVLQYSPKHLLHNGQSEPGQDCKNKIYVKGFKDVYWTHQDLYEHFEKFGKIFSANVSIDAKFNSLGYGFVTYENAEEASAAIENVI